MQAAKLGLIPNILYGPQNLSEVIPEHRVRCNQPLSIAEYGLKTKQTKIYLLRYDGRESKTYSPELKKQRETYMFKRKKKAAQEWKSPQKIYLALEFSTYIKINSGIVTGKPLCTVGGPVINSSPLLHGTYIPKSG